MMFKTEDVRLRFAEMYERGFHEEHPEGMLEMLGASFLADDETIFREPNTKYRVAEVDWYDSQSLNVNDLNEFYGSVPVIWKEHAANTRGEINSNYGYLVYSQENGSQYDNVLRELRTNPNSRRACMVYQRPSMHVDFRKDGINDFVCTNAVSYHISSGGLHCVVQMRSNDAVFGYINDVYWQRRVLSRLACDLELEVGQMVWQAQSLHIYPRHIKHVEYFARTGIWR